MKTKICFGCTPLILAAVLAGGSSVVVSAAPLPPPVITSIQTDRAGIVVQVQVPAGLRRVTLESRDHWGQRPWEPIAVVRLDGTGHTTTFRLPCSRPLEILRVRGDVTEGLPEAFFTGTNAFTGEVVTSSDGSVPMPTAYRSYTMFDSVTATPEPATRDVVESDIWKFRGETLYFFNQYRGLQIIDLTDPDAAVVRGTLELPAAGEQMYLLGADHVVLLARAGCQYNQSQVLVVADHPSGPEIVASLPVTGSIGESRMVGTALYVAASTYRSLTNAGGSVTWESGTMVHSFDLANPAAPVVRDPLWYSGYGNDVAATDIYLFVVTQNQASYWQSDVRIIDITSPEGVMAPYATLTTAGRVADKFKLNYSGSVLTTISEDRRSTPTARVTTRLETFHLPDPRALGPVGVVKLGELELGRGESLHATRFDGDRVYVVTFFQIDPLWVVSLADPARPAIAGSVEIPGWSTYIQPLGDRLVTVGVETGRVAVSLFDVADATKPTLASRVLLGQTHSWTEANYDEKAFMVLPHANLVLVPFNGDFTNRYGSAVQLIDLNRDSLVARGQVTGTFQFRRATTYADRMLSVSGWELLTVDATDRDHPVVRHQLELAWTTDRVFVSGPYLIELQNGASWDNASGPSLRVALADTPHTVLGGLSLTNLPILGATLQGQHLYLAQGEGGYVHPYLLEAGSNTTPPPEPNFVLTVVNLGALPTLSVAGQTQTYLPALGWGSEWQPVWPKPDVLVWAGGGYNYGWWGGPWDVIPLAGAMLDARWIMPWPYWGGRGGHLLAFAVSDPAAPVFAAEVNLTTNNWWSFSRAFAANGLVYLSHQMSEPLESVPPQVPDPTTATNNADGTIGTGSNRVAPIRYWVQRSFLDVVDFTVPDDPLLRRPVNIPGTLTAISPDGQLIYTTGPHWTTNTAYDWTEYLDVSAYLGSEVRLVDSLRLAQSWPHPVHIVGPNVFVGRPDGDASVNATTPYALENWTVSIAGRFELLNRVPLNSPASVLADFDGMLAVQETDNSLDLFLIGNAAGLHLIGRGEPAGCWWFDLSRGDGDSMVGLWLPLGVYGVGHVPVK